MGAPERGRLSVPTPANATALWYKLSVDLQFSRSAQSDGFRRGSLQKDQPSRHAGGANSEQLRDCLAISCELWPVELDALGKSLFVALRDVVRLEVDHVGGDGQAAVRDDDESVDAAGENFVAVADGKGAFTVNG